MSSLEELFIKNLGGGGKNGLSEGDLKFSAVLSWCLIRISNNKEISNQGEKKLPYHRSLNPPR